MVKGNEYIYLSVDPEGAVNVILTTPMWVVNTRLKLQGAKFRNEDLHQTHYRGVFGGYRVEGAGLLSPSSVSLSRLRLPLSDAFAQIVASEGVGVLWNGTLPSLILVLNPAVHFMFYEAMKRKVGREGRKVSGGQEGPESETGAWVASAPVKAADPARLGSFLGFFFVSDFLG